MKTIHPNALTGTPGVASGDIDLTLLSGLQLPGFLGDYLPDSTSERRATTLWVYPEGQTNALTSIQVSREDMAALTNSLSDRNTMNWLRKKLQQNRQQELVDQLLVLHDQFSEADSVLSQPVLELIRERLVEVLGKTHVDIDLKFEHFRLTRDLQEAAKEAVESLVLAHRPDMGTVYDSEDVKKLILQAGGVPSKAAANSHGESDRDGADKPSQRDGNNQHDERQENHLPGKGGGKQVLADNSPKADAPSKLTITFVGQQKVGKSMLANCLLGYRFFRIQ